jgi:hypothetical protein
MISEPQLAECTSCRRLNTAPEGCLPEWNAVPAYCGSCRKIVTHKLLRRDRAVRHRVPHVAPLNRDHERARHTASLPENDS